MRNRRTWIHYWILKRAVLGLAVAALVVPAAAQARIDAAGDSQSPAVTKLVGHQQPVLPCAPNCVLENDQVRPGEPSTVSTPQVVSAPGFDWGDAGIGAGAAVGLVLLGGAGFRASRHLGKPQTA